MLTTVLLPGMHCDSCVKLLKDISSEFSAIVSITVDLPMKQVTLDHDESFNLQQWVEAVESLGPQYNVQRST